MTSNWFKGEDRRSRKARQLLQPAVAGLGGTWADLGCGDGVFTLLLDEFLQPGSELYAIDKNKQALRQLERKLKTGSNSSIHLVPADFTQTFSLPSLDGLLMANSLHFVVDKISVLARLIEHLKPGGCVVVIEYNTNRVNYAVPYPLDETDFLKLAAQLGLIEAEIVAKVPSSFLGEMYTGVGLNH